MNDPGLHEPAQEAAQDVEKKEHDEDEQAEEEEQEYLDPGYVSQASSGKYYR
jgi:potassium channel subfamily K